MIGTIQAVRERLTSGATTSRALTEEILERIAMPEGEGSRVFTRIDADRARRSADAADGMRRARLDFSPLCGIPISYKDLYDVEGEITTAASPQRRNAARAGADSVAIARLRRAGAVLIGGTNMTEFAFSGLGLNPHFGTPANPFDRKVRRIPGGSSSGAAISVTDGMAVAALGSDTGGSIRIPAALCGLTGFKPTKSRIPMTGAFPLAPSLDSAGPLAASVACCAAVDAVLAGECPWRPEPAHLSALSFAVPKNFFLDDLDAHVAQAFELALSRLSRAGAKLTRVAVPEMDEIMAVYAKGGLASPEAYAFHRRAGTDLDRCDALVGERIHRGESISAADYLDMIEARAGIIDRFDKAHGSYDAILCPAVAVIAPEIARLDADLAEQRRVNALILRNASVVNFLGRCALSIPCHRAGEAPVGLMVVGRRMEDRQLLEIGVAVELALG